MTITINPKNKKELDKIKTILKAIEVDFIESEDSYDKDFVLKIEKSRKEISKGCPVLKKRYILIDKNN